MQTKKIETEEAERMSVKEKKRQEKAAAIRSKNDELSLRTTMERENQADEAINQELISKMTKETSRFDCFKSITDVLVNNQGSFS